MLGCTIYPGSEFFSFPEPESEIRISYPRAKKKHWILDPQPDGGSKCQFLISLNIALYLKKNSRKYDLGCMVYPGSGFFSFPEPGSEIRISYPRAKKALDPGSAI